MTETIDPRPRAVLGVDPGTTTGLAVVMFDPAGRPSQRWDDQLPWHEAAGQAEIWIRSLAKSMREGGIRDAAAACEKFTITRNTAQRGQEPAEDTLGMIGVVRRDCGKYGVPMGKTEPASAAKKLVSDKLLKALDLYSPGHRHVNDALRHAILYATKAGWFDKQLYALALG